MNNQDVADHLATIAQLMRQDGAGTFRCIAYDRAAKTIRDMSEDVRNVTLIELPGIGQSTASVISEFLTTGTSLKFEDLSTRWSPEVLSMTAVPGIGPKKAYKLHAEGIASNFDELVAKARAGELDSKLTKAIQFTLEAQDRIPLPQALAIGQYVLDHVKALPGVQKAELCGSLRRGKETVKDLDVVVCVDDKQRVMPILSKFAQLGELVSSGEHGGRTSVRLRHNDICIQCDLWIVESWYWGSALNYATGSKAHNKTLRAIAKKRGLTVSEYGIYKVPSEERIGGEKEEDLYRILGIPYHPPELREDELWQQIPALLTIEEVKGDGHCHCVVGTTLVDTNMGLMPIEELSGLRCYVSSLEGKRAKVANWKNSGVQPIKKIVTSRGFELEATKNHPVLVFTKTLEFEWKLVKELKIGDMLCLHKGGLFPRKEVTLRGYKYVGKQNLCKYTYVPSQMSKELARVLGYLLAEGCGNEHKLTFCNTNLEIIKDFECCFNKCFPGCHLSRTSKHNLIVLEVCSRYVNQFLIYCGLDTALSYDKTVPWSILQSTRESVANFIGAFCEGDGSTAHGVELYSSSKKLIQQLQVLLLKFKIVSTQVSYLRKRRHREYKLRCFSLEARQLFQAILFSKKGKRINKSLITKPKLDKVPFVREAMAQLLSARLITQKGGRPGLYRNDEGTPVTFSGNSSGLNIAKVMFRRSEAVTRTLLSFISERLAHVSKAFARKLKHLGQVPYFFDPIVTLEEANRRRVFDIAVHKSHCFVGGGIICHNSWWSPDADKTLSIQVLAQQAQARGYEYICVTDHSYSGHFQRRGAISTQAVDNYVAECKAAEQKIGIRVLAGIECDILLDGSLQWPIDLLGKLDYALGAIHRSHGQNVTERYIKAMQSGLVNGIAHPTTRLFGSRPPAQADWQKVFRVAKQMGVAMEINGSSGRLDLDSDLTYLAATAGVKLFLSSDSHSLDGLAAMDLAVTLARRAGITKKHLMKV